MPRTGRGHNGPAEPKVYLALPKTNKKQTEQTKKSMIFFVMIYIFHSSRPGFFSPLQLFGTKEAHEHVNPTNHQTLNI